MDAHILKTNMLRYATFLVRRNLVCNTLGTIAARGDVEGDGRGWVYTKRKGTSLEEMGMEDIVKTDLEMQLLEGRIPPSIGHQLNCAILRERPDVNAVIHVHPNIVIGFFTGTGRESFRFVGDDTPLVLQKPVHVLKDHVNVELDTEEVPGFIKTTNLFVMPNHGVTSLGSCISEAYHRLTSFVAEVERQAWTCMLSGNVARRDFKHIAPDEVDKMFAAGLEVIYGGARPVHG